MPDLTRRSFLKTSAAAGAVVTLGELTMRPALAAESPAASSAAGAASPPVPSWMNQPMRWAQLTLVEDDPGKFDPAFWLDYFQRTKADAVCLSGGGCVAFYPTQVPFHHRSAWLGDRDVFGDLVAGCRKLGLVVLARTDPHATYDEVQAAHPDWIAVTADGRPRRHWASPEMWVTCGLGPYNFEFMTAVKQEIMTRYQVDGIFINRWNGSGMCYCVHCVQNFKTATGFDLPRTNNPQDSVRRAHLLWSQQRLFDLWQVWDGAVRRIKPDSCVIPNTGGGALSPLDMKAIGALSPMLAADRQARSGLAAPWANGKNGKEFRATMGRKPIIGIFSVGLEEPERWKDSVQSDAEIRLWVLDGIANGLRPWYSKFSGVIHDPRWLKGVAELFIWHQQNEKYLRHETPLARVALVYSQQTARFYGGDRAAAAVEDHTLGWYQALIESRVQFEMVHDGLLDAAHVSQFKTLILPNLAALSDAQCDQLRAFVARGGGLVATHETSLCDEWGVRRKDFGLGDLLGVTWDGRTEGPMQNSYLRLEHAAAPAHPLLVGLEDAPRIVNGVARVVVTPREKFATVPLTLIPSYPDLPMEKVYPRVEKTDIAGVYLRESGAGRVVYFPWDIDRTFWEVLCVDHLKLLRNAVAWATNEPPPVAVTGPGLLDVTAWRNQDALVIHLVNLTNPMALKGPVREFIPVAAQTVRLQLPAGVTPRGVRLLVAGGTPAFRQTGNLLEVTVPSVLDHEVVAVDLPPA